MKKKKKYRPPKLFHLGRAVNLTRGGNSAGGDLYAQKLAPPPPEP